MSTHVYDPTELAQSHLPQVTEPRNPGMPLDMDWVRAVQVNLSLIHISEPTRPY